MEVGLSQVDGAQLFVGYHDTCGVVRRVKFGVYSQTLGRRRIGDTANDHLKAQQRTTSPILSDMSEHSVIDLVPFPRARQEVTHMNRYPQPISEPVQRRVPTAGTAAAAPAAVVRDQQGTGAAV